MDKRQDEEIRELQDWREGVSRVVHGDDQFQWKGIMAEHNDLKAHVVTVEGTLTEMLNTTKGAAKFVMWFLSIIGGIGGVVGILKAFSVI